ncbi:MAG: NADH-quinone oxidoreductase subunit H [Candidatus Omnitrophota bacterium]|nr:NADH-quinone oxidoreductase subunit H [Candidatus Omnitrophota bacterium]
MSILEYLFLFLVFPGFLFSGSMGLLIGWIDRKVTARLQYRVGPPWYQNFIDIIKLMYKETLIPQGASTRVFFAMPLIAMACATLVSTILLVLNWAPDSGFVGDLIVVVYLLMVPPIALMLGGFASGNPLASLGSSREMKLMLSYELPFLLALTVPIIKSGYAINVGSIITCQQESGLFIASISGVLSFIVMIFCIQAKAGFVPFDMPEAETEIASGPYIEYSGRALAVFKITKAIILFVLPALLITLYFGGIVFTPRGLLNAVGQYLLILVVMIVIKNTNPRVRIDQAVRFFWRIPTALAVVAIILAYFRM